MLRRCNYLTLEVENVAPLPPERGGYSYGTVSPDHRWYAVAVRPEGADASRVDLLNIETGEWRVLLDKEGYHAKHEQFSRDGRNRVLIQLNQMPDVKQVLLGEIDLGGELKLFPADQPHTLRPTGHEAWVGDTSSIFFSTAADPETGVNIWIGAVGDEGPTPVPGGRASAMSASPPMVATGSATRGRRVCRSTSGASRRGAAGARCSAERSTTGSSGRTRTRT